MMAFVVRDPPRQVHITRILGTNKDGEVLPDIWLDVERFEFYAKVTQNADGQYQRVATKLRWHDDPDDVAEYQPENDDGTARTVPWLNCSPDEADLNDPEQWVPVRVIMRRLHLSHGEEVGSDTNLRFTSAQPQKVRKVELRRFSHYDSSIDEAATAAFDADPARKAYVANSDAYQKDDETKDDGQYVECEVVLIVDRQVSAHGQSSGTDQKVFLKLKNQYLLDESEPRSLARSASMIVIRDTGSTRFKTLSMSIGAAVPSTSSAIGSAISGAARSRARRPSCRSNWSRSAKLGQVVTCKSAAA